MIPEPVKQQKTKSWGVAFEYGKEGMKPLAKLLILFFVIGLLSLNADADSPWMMQRSKEIMIYVFGSVKWLLLAAKVPIILFAELGFLVVILKRVKKHKLDCGKLMQDAAVLKNWCIHLTEQTLLLNSKQ